MQWGKRVPCHFLCSPRTRPAVRGRPMRSAADHVVRVDSAPSSGHDEQDSCEQGAMVISARALKLQPKNPVKQD